MRTPSLNALRMFDAAARHLNFRLAAEELNLTQGAVAQQVRHLEAELGLKLFDRKARGLALTAIGRTYHAPVHRALAMIEEATEKLHPQSTQLVLSVTPSFAAKWLVPRLGAFEKAHPGIDIQTVASEGLSNFQSDGVDLAIRQGHPPFGEDVLAVLLAPLELCAVCSPALGEEIGHIEHLKDFAGHRLIQDSHNLWDRLLEEAAPGAPFGKVQFNQSALAMDAAANGQGIALVPRLLADADISQKKLTVLWRDTAQNQPGYYIVYPNQDKQKPARQIMIDWFLSQVSPSVGAL